MLTGGKFISRIFHLCFQKTVNRQTAVHGKKILISTALGLESQAVQLSESRWQQQPILYQYWRNMGPGGSP